jgi:hypothetical protein
MTDRTDPPGRTDPPERSDPPALDRDGGMAARLAVEPLDEVTRARLVRTALAAQTADQTVDMAAAAPGRRRPIRWLAAAAVLVGVLAVGVSLLVRSSDSPRTTAGGPTAAKPASGDRSREFSADEQGTGLQENLAAPDSLTSPTAAAVPSLGDLGEVGRASQLRTAVERAKTKTKGTANGRFRPECPTPAIATAGVLISGGTGTVDGKPVSVYVFEAPDAGKVAVAVLDASCVTVLTAPF